jgi:hypothetical protein
LERKKRMNLAHVGKHCAVVFAQFRQHIAGIDVLRSVIAEVLRAGNVGDRSNRSATDFAHALGDVAGKNLAGLLLVRDFLGDHGCKDLKGV